MTRLAAQIGLWAAWEQTAVGYGYLLGYVVLIAGFPLQPWTDIESFAAQLNTPYMKALTMLQLLAFLQALLVLVLAITLHEYAAPDRQILTRLGMAFALAFAMLSSLHYYVQWVGVRQSIFEGNMEGLGLFVQFNFDSPLSAINMLGWMFFYGLTTLCLAPIFGASRIEVWIHRAFLLNGVGCIASAVLLALGQKWVFLLWTILISLTWYAYPLLGVLFYRMRSQPRANTPIYSQF